MLIIVSESDLKSFAGKYEVRIITFENGKPVRLEGHYNNGMIDYSNRAD
jgi:hypothetical protein